MFTYIISKLIYEFSIQRDIDVVQSELHVHL